MTWSMLFGWHPVSAGRLVRFMDAFEALCNVMVLVATSFLTLGKDDKALNKGNAFAFNFRS